MMPPIRFGMKNTERKILVPANRLVSMYAIANAATLITMVVTIVNSTVYTSAFQNSLSCTALT